jgi:cyclopropane fatty-acyl-phospholipid synthase-like methyltransferase
MKIDTETGIWHHVQPSDHHNDVWLSRALSGLVYKLKVNSIADLGCGNGYYINNIRKSYPNVNCRGFDGSPDTTFLAFNNCEILELHKPIDISQFDSPFDLIISLEVGEHIPAEFEDIYVDIG